MTYLPIDGYNTADGYVLTYVAADKRWISLSAGSGTFIAGGDLTGTSSSQQVVSLTGSGGLVNMPSSTSLEIGSHSVVAQSGLIRLGDIGHFGTDTTIIAYRNHANNADIPLLTSSAVGVVYLQSDDNTFLYGGSGAGMQNGSGQQFTISGGNITSYNSHVFMAQVVSTFTFDSDVTLTSWLYNINGTNLLQITPTGVFIANTSAPATPTGGGILYVNGGALHYLGSSGTNTVIAPA